ncbi:MAG: UxaA family hydrolase, partial [Chloroflexota bacterium]
QVQIWRDWRLPNEKIGRWGAEGMADSRDPMSDKLTDGFPLINQTALKSKSPHPPILRSPHLPTSHRSIALILPTSLCSGQVARMMVDRLNQSELADQLGVERFETLVHTEGCGFSKGAHALFVRSLIGYLQHPMVSHALLLEHGCEKTHNDYFRQRFAEAGLKEADFGWASIQADGGIVTVMDKIERWFEAQPRGMARQHNAAQGLSLALVGAPHTQDQIPPLIEAVIGGGGSVILPEKGAPLDVQQAFGLSGGITLSYGQRPAAPGLHIMETPTDNWAETLTGLGAAGPNLIAAFSQTHPQPGHPLVPTLQIRWEDAKAFEEDYDLSRFDFDKLIQLMGDTLAGHYEPVSKRTENHVFQMTRGTRGISL